MELDWFLIRGFLLIIKTPNYWLLSRCPKTKIGRLLEKLDSIILKPQEWKITYKNKKVLKVQCKIMGKENQQFKEIYSIYFWREEAANLQWSSHLGHWPGCCFSSKRWWVQDGLWGGYTPWQPAHLLLPPHHWVFDGSRLSELGKRGAEVCLDYV